MSFTSFLGVLWRRWYVALPGLLLVLVAVVAGLALGPKTYEAKAQVLFLPSNRIVDGAAKGEISNPFLMVNPSVGVAADVTRLAVSTKTVQKQVADRAGGGTYQVGFDPSTTNPILLVDAKAGSPQVAVRTLGLVRAELTDELRRRQQAAGAPVPSWITMTTVAADSRASRAWMGTVRYSIVGGLLVLLLAVGTVVAADSLLSRREGLGGRQGGRETGGSGDARPADQDEEPAADQARLARPRPAPADAS